MFEPRTIKNSLSIALIGLVFTILMAPTVALAEACIPGAISSSPCPDNPGIQEIPDGPTVTACPATFVFEGCTNKPKTGSGNTLCCRNPVTGGTGSDCTPKSPETGYTYICMFKEGCTGVSGKEYTYKSDDIKCSDNSQVCCQAKSRTGTPVSSASTTKSSEVLLVNPLGTSVTLVEIVGRIIKAFLGITGAIALAVFVFGGIMWMTARGDAGQVKKAQDAIKYGAIGLILIMFSYVLAGGFVKFWTSEKQDVETQEGRTTTEAPTPASTKQADINSQKQQICDNPYSCFSEDDKSHIMDKTQLVCTGKTCTAGLAQGECCKYK